MKPKIKQQTPKLKLPIYRAAELLLQQVP
jgi:hypothetical protein